MKMQDNQFSYLFEGSLKQQCHHCDESTGILLQLYACVGILNDLYVNAFGEWKPFHNLAPKSMQIYEKEYLVIELGYWSGIFAGLASAA